MCTDNQNKCKVEVVDGVKTPSMDAQIWWKCPTSDPIIQFWLLLLVSH